MSNSHVYFKCWLRDLGRITNWFNKKGKKKTLFGFGAKATIWTNTGRTDLWNSLPKDSRSIQTMVFGVCSQPFYSLDKVYLQKDVAMPISEFLKCLFFFQDVKSCLEMPPQKPLPSGYWQGKLLQGKRSISRNDCLIRMPSMRSLEGTPMASLGND